MKNITTLKFDFVVVGSGLTGLCAAIAAALSAQKNTSLRKHDPQDIRKELSAIGVQL